MQVTSQHQIKVVQLHKVCTLKMRIFFIFHASGGTGNGVFQEAKSLNESGDKSLGNRC